jgi:hypothetical protein
VGLSITTELLTRIDAALEVDEPPVDFIRTALKEKLERHDRQAKRLRHSTKRRR